MHTLFKQTHKEALYSLILTGLYFLWWYIGAYIPGSIPVEEYTFIFGMPLWFFLSCIAGTILFSFLAWVMVRFFFKEIAFEE